MNLKKSILAIAAIMAISTVSFADSKNDANLATSKSESATATIASNAVELQWFHFTGAAGEEGNTAKYTQESAPECPSQTENLRCDIQAYNQVANPTQPDLSTIAQERNVED